MNVNAARQRPDKVYTTRRLMGRARGKLFDVYLVYVYGARRRRGTPGCACVKNAFAYNRVVRDRRSCSSLYGVRGGSVASTRNVDGKGTVVQCSTGRDRF